MDRLEGLEENVDRLEGLCSALVVSLSLSLSPSLPASLLFPFLSPLNLLIPEGI